MPPMEMRPVRRWPGSCAPGTPGEQRPDQIAVAEKQSQIPVGHIETIAILLRVDSAGASHELFDWCREGHISSGRV